MKKFFIYTILVSLLWLCKADISLGQNDTKEKDHYKHWFGFAHAGLDTTGYEKSKETSDGIVTEYKRVNALMYGGTVGYKWQPATNFTHGYDYPWEAPTVALSATYIGAGAEAVLVGGHFDPKYKAPFPLVGLHIGLGTQTDIAFNSADGISKKPFSQFLIGISGSAEVVEDVGINVMILTTGIMGGVGFHF